MPSNIGPAQVFRTPPGAASVARTQTTATRPQLPAPQVNTSRTSSIANVLRTLGGTESTGKVQVNVSRAPKAATTTTEAINVVAAAAEGDDAAKAAIQGTIDRARNGDGAAAFAADLLSDAARLRVRAFYVQKWVFDVAGGAPVATGGTPYGEW